MANLSATPQAIEERLSAERATMGLTWSALRERWREQTDWRRQIRLHPAAAATAAAAVGLTVGYLLRRASRF